VSLRILAVTSEAFPLAKSGGLGDAVSGMARTLQMAAGHQVSILLPAYPGTREQLSGVREVARLHGLPGGDARLLSGRCAALGDVTVLLLENDALYDRTGLYVDADGREYGDNAIRFGALAHAAVRIASGLPGTEGSGAAAPDIIHAHDWHAGLVPLLLRIAGVQHVRSVITIHNMAFQGVYPMHLSGELGIPAAYLGVEGIEYWGQISFLKAGIRYADRITTVSHTYAREILTPLFGCGLQGLLQTRVGDLVAVPNGIDAAEWDPATDPHLGRNRYNASRLENKARCKRALQRHFGLLERAAAPLMVMGSRLTAQKMADVALQALPQALDDHPDLQVAVLGQGDKAIETGIAQLQRRYPGRCGVRIGFDEATAHRLHAGADILLHGSRFEPFGLTPLYAMRYGAIPIGSKVGGMADTIIDPGRGAGRDAMRTATGVLFEGDSVDAMASAITRTLGLYRCPDIWRAMQHRAMTTDHSWERAVPLYSNLFRGLAPAAFGDAMMPTSAPRRSRAGAAAVRALPGGAACLGAVLAAPMAGHSGHGASF